MTSSQASAQPVSNLGAALYFEQPANDVWRIALTPRLLIVRKKGAQAQVVELSPTAKPHPLAASIKKIPPGGSWAVSPDGRFLATTNIETGENAEDVSSPIKLWSLPSLKLIGTHNYSYYSSIAFNRDSSLLYVLNEVPEDEKGLVIINLRNGSQRALKTETSSGDMMALSPDGTLVVTEASDDVGVYLDILNLKTKARGVEDITTAFLDLKTFHRTTPEPLFISPKNDFVWVGNIAFPFDRKSKIGKPLFRFSDAQERALLMDKKGRILSLNFKLKRLRLWDVRRKRIVAQSGLLIVKPEVKELWPPPPETLTAASSDGRFVALWQEGKLQVWRLNLPPS